MKWRIVRVGKAALGIPREEIMRLAMVVAMDYERRRRGERPDRWHWADRILFNEGYVLLKDGWEGSIVDWWGQFEQHECPISTSNHGRTRSPAVS